MHQRTLSTSRWFVLLSLSLPLAACAESSGGTPDGSGDAASGSGASPPSAGAGDGASGQGGASGPGASSGSGGSGPALDLSSLTSEAASSICGALFRCCDPVSRADYFALYAAHPALEPFADAIPPSHEFADEAECVSTVTQMLEVRPWRDWIDAAEASEVAFDASAFASCRQTLESAACGIEVAQALYDSTCLGFGAPQGGDFQRRMFSRTRGPGESCRPIRDGIGSGFYGSCDPHAAFCCYLDSVNPSGGCVLPFDDQGQPRAGTCNEVAGLSQACASTPPMKLCETGFSCSASTDKCFFDADGPLAVGDPCMDDDYNLLGECVASFCDVLGTALCEPLKADGAQCYSGYECQSDACVDQVCGVSTFCVAP